MSAVRPILLAAALVLAGCQTEQYLVIKDNTPLYAAASGDRVLARMPRLHHQELPDGVELRNGRVRLDYEGTLGYAPRGALRLFHYLDPALDGGQDRWQTLQQELREAQLEEVGGKWPAGVVAAIRAGHVQVGMTRRQVELAWGWPLDVEPGPLQGEQRWLYRIKTEQTIRHYVDDPWPVSTWGPYPCAPAWRWHSAWSDPGWVELRIPFVEERVVTVGRDGKVQGVSIKRYPAST